MKKTFLFLLFLWSAVGFAQLAPFTVTATKVNDETCPSNGAISWTASPKTAGSTMTYSITNAAGTVVATASQNPDSDTNTFSGLVAGTYTVTATQTLGAQSNSAKSAAIVIANQKVTLAYSTTTNNEVCSNDGSITVYVSTGRAPYTYQLLDASNNVSVSQASNIFTGLAAGNYNVRVIDQCGSGTVSTVAVTKYNTVISNFYLTGKLYPDCNNVTLSVNNVAAKGPYTLNIQYTDPVSNQPVNLTATSTSLQDLIKIPKYNVTSLPIKATLADGCGNSFTKNIDFKFTEEFYSYFSTVNCGARTLSIYSTTNQNGFGNSLFKINYISIPSAYDPAVDTNNGKFANLHNLGDSNGLPAGTYNYELEDQCGNKYPRTFTIGDNVSPTISTSIIRQCDSDKFTISIWLNYLGYKYDYVKITSAPAEYSSQHTLPYTLPESVYNYNNDRRQVYINDLSAGSYTVEYSICGKVYTTNFITPTTYKVQPSKTVDIKVNCANQVNIVETPANYWNTITIQKYDEAKGTWGYPGSLGNYGPYTVNFPYVAMIQPGVWTDLKGKGRYRVIRLPFENVYGMNVNGQTNSYYCDPYVLKEFTIGDPLTYDNAYAFQCADGSYDVAISASEGTNTLHYAIVSDGTSTATIIRDNGTAPIFHGVAAGSYYFRVMDDCGNFITRKLDMAQLGKPGVSIVSDCSTTPGSLKLVVNGVDYLKFEWRKTRDASGNAIASPPVIATTSILDLGTYDSTDAGTYTVHMYTDPAAGYCIDNSVDMSLTVDALSAAHAGTGQTVNIIYDGTTQSLNLFSYLTGQYDAFGTWTETTVPPSALLTGFNWNIAAAAPGTYTFRYTVAAPCGGATDSSYVTINLSKLCYKLPATSGGTTEDTRFGITALGRAGSNSDNWPMLRKGGWMAMEANTKGFVVNRVAFTAGNQPVGIPPANYVAGMMVYDTTNKCLKIYNGTVWSCFTTPTCPN